MIIIEMKAEDIEYANKIVTLNEENTGIMHQSSFSGIDDLIFVGIALTSIIVPKIAKIIVEMIKKDKTVRIKVGDMEIDGLTKKNALKEMEKLLKYTQKQNKSKSNDKK